jgi:hypothetical protein
MEWLHQWLPVAAFLLLCGCEATPKVSPNGAGKPSPANAKALVRKANLAAAVPSTASKFSSESNEPSEHLVSTSPKRADALTLGNTEVVFDDLVDVAPAGPSVATPTGVLMLLRDTSPRFAPLSPSRASKSKRPQATQISPLSLDPTELTALAYGPSIARGYVYFIVENRLVRRHLVNHSVEILATDARRYTRVVVPNELHPDLPIVVGYIAQHPTEKDTLLARLWVEGQPSVTLTPDGSTGHSVTLAKTLDGYVAVSLESRTGMSPLHARRLKFIQGKLSLGPDVVPWVAGTAQSLTELFGVSRDDDVFTFLPIERDATHFGLARVEVGADPQLGAAVHWREYPNGLSPAVVTGGRLCGKPVVLYARPATEAPRATQELHLSAIDDQGLGPSTIAATSRAFADASFAGLDDGALVVYVADRRTWARRLRCVPQ